MIYNILKCRDREIFDSHLSNFIVYLMFGVGGDLNKFVRM